MYALKTTYFFIDTKLSLIVKTKVKELFITHTHKKSLRSLYKRFVACVMLLTITKEATDMFW